MKLFIIRHAQSENNVLESQDYEFYMRNRVVDPSITTLGFKQADRVAQHLSASEHAEHVHENGDEDTGYRFTHIFVSPMLRCLQTARPISQALNLAPEVWVDIHEQGGMFLGNPRTGEDLRFFTGMTRLEMESQFPDYRIPETIDEDGWWNGGHEDDAQCEKRAMRVAAKLREIATAMQHERVALISHGTFADRLLKALIGLPTDTRQCFFSHYNTAITRVDFREEGYAAVRFTNRVQHLPPKLVSM